MRKYLLLTMGLMLVASVFIASACSSGEAEGVTQEASQEIARQYVLSEPTFKFDGMEETLKLADTITLRCPYCWEFVFEFDCRQPGYGDRTGLMLAQVITPHTARIEVQKGAVASAVMDGKWDMMKQISIEGGG